MTGRDCRTRTGARRLELPPHARARLRLARASPPNRPLRGLRGGIEVIPQLARPRRTTVPLRLDFANPELGSAAAVDRRILNTPREAWRAGSADGVAPATVGPRAALVELVAGVRIGRATARVVTKRGARTAAIRRTSRAILRSGAGAITAANALAGAVAGQRAGAGATAAATSVATTLLAAALRRAATRVVASGRAAA